MSEDSNSSKNAGLMSKPWFQEAYKAAMDFYKKDDQLDSRDRLELSKAYQSIARAELWGGWFGFSCVFLSPFAYQFYKTNAIRGVRVPRNFMLGLLAMFGTTQLAGNYMYSQKLASLDPDGILASKSSYEEHDQVSEPEAKTSLQRQYEMMKLLDNGSPARWAAYFYMTYQNPARRLPNPQVKLEQMKNGSNTQRGSFMNQRDPMGLYSGPAFEKKENFPDSKRLDSASKAGDSMSSSNSWEAIRQSKNVPTSSWDRVRHNGSSNTNNSTVVPELHRDEDDDPFATVDHPSQLEFDALLEKERNGEDSI